MRCRLTILILLAFFAALNAAIAQDDANDKNEKPKPFSTDGNRLAYLDHIDPYYPHRDFAKLITPQWIGEEGVEAVVILSIDDMRDPRKYENYLRPILDRLKKIDGRAPLSIFTNSVNPADPQLQAWLKEGLSFEVHTLAHPCPLLGRRGFEFASETYHGCVDLLAQIPNTSAVAYRMPCCDSMNSVSPRFFAEIFNKQSENGNHLAADSSVFMLYTANDPALPRELVFEADGETERFRKYLPAGKGYVNYIEDYPYPYIIGNTCWQFPVTIPSDWEAQHLHKSNNPKTVEDWKHALDATVIKQGVMTVCFHPHGWIKAEQIVELIDHAQKKHGRKVKFLTMREAVERLNQNLLGGQTVRVRDRANGVRVLDVNNDGYMDVLVGQRKTRLTRTWTPKHGWKHHAAQIYVGSSSPLMGRDSGVRIGVGADDGSLMALEIGEIWRHGWEFKAGLWRKNDKRMTGLHSEDDGWRALAAIEGIDLGTRLRDIDGDGVCEIIACHGGFWRDNDDFWRGNDTSNSAIFRWDLKKQTWSRLPFELPGDVMVITVTGRKKRQAEVAFVDVDGDGDLDIIHSNHERFGVYLFEGFRTGWSRVLVDVRRGEESPLVLPPIVRADGTNNGFFIKNRALYWMNEDTGEVQPHHVVKVTFDELLEAGRKREKDGDGEKENDGKQSNAAPAPPPLAASRERPDNQNDSDNATNEPKTANDPNADHPPLTPPSREGDKKHTKTSKKIDPPPLSPQQALKSFEVRPGYRLELVAAEPLVMDPVAFDWGPDGKLWVVEMADYPNGMKGNHEPGGRVVYLTDTDDDGRYDTRTVFLDQLSYPTGVMAWDKGVLVTMAPVIFYAEDSTGDGKADKRQDLFRGFGEGNQQHRVNGLRWGLDNWIHIGNGDSGGVIEGVGTGDKVNIRGRDARIGSDDLVQSVLQIFADPKNPPDAAIGRGWILQATSGQTQFGRNRDDFGNWFGSNNPNPGWHYVLDDRYLRRNPHVAAPSPRVDLTADRNVYPISRVFSPSIENHQPGKQARHSSANSLMIYRDDLFGPAFTPSIDRMTAFVSEPVHNLVRRMALTRKGVTFEASRPPGSPGEETREFLASRDVWFRPTTLRTGPDGCLWIADMYRHVIEHPKWIPPAWQEKLDLRAGDDRGRIYRVVPVGLWESSDPPPLREGLGEGDEPTDTTKNATESKDDSNTGTTKLSTDDRGADHPHTTSPSRGRGRSARRFIPNEPARTPRLDKLDVQQLVAALESSNGWQRDMAHIFFLTCHGPSKDERETIYFHVAELNSPNFDEIARKFEKAVADVEMVGLLERIVLEGKRPESRVQALCVLGGVDLTRATTVLRAMHDPHPAVRRHAVRAFESIVHDRWMTGIMRAHGAGKHALINRVLELSSDPDPTVRIQVAYTLGEVSNEDRAGEALAKLLADDPYIHVAALSSAQPYVYSIVKTVFESSPTPIHSDGTVQALMRMVAASDDARGLGRLLSDLITNEMKTWQFEALLELDTAFGGKWPKVELRGTLDLDQSLAVISLQAERILEKEKSADARRQAAALRAVARFGEVLNIPKTLLPFATDATAHIDVQRAAVEELLRLENGKHAPTLLERWSRLAPTLRPVVIDQLLRRDALTTALLDAIEKNHIDPRSIDTPRKQRLLSHKDASIRTRAEKLLGGPVDADRAKLIKQYEPALALKGDAARGRAIFEKNCAACHQLGGVGKDVGPDLRAVTDRSGPALLTAILDPNRAVESKYLNYLVETLDGEGLTGIITNESGNAVTLVNLDGNARTILRKDIDRLRSTSKSLMPEGLEKAIDPQAMADVIAFVQRAGPAAKEFAGNQPRTIAPNEAGALVLPAAAAEVYGPSAVFEQKYGNIGYWHSEQDHAVWTIDVKQAGTYEVSLDFALPAAVARNGYTLSVADQKLTGAVPATGSWDNYVTRMIGRVELKAGEQRLTFRSKGPVSGALIDLRTVTLRRVEK